MATLVQLAAFAASLGRTLTMARPARWQAIQSHHAPGREHRHAEPDSAWGETFFIEVADAQNSQLEVTLWYLLIADDVCVDVTAGKLWEGRRVPSAF